MLIKIEGQNTFDFYHKPWYHTNQSGHIVTTADSGFVMLTYVIDSATSRQDVNLSKLDKSGNMLNNKTFQIQNSNQYYTLEGKNQFIADGKNAYFWSGLFASSYSGVAFARFNATTLDTIKTTRYADNNFHYVANNVIKLSDNKYYCIGSKWDVTNTWPVIFHLDSNLNIIQLITVNTSNNFGCFNAVLNPFTRQILLGGIIPSGNYPNCLVQIDTLGTVTNSITSTSFFTVNSTQYFFSPADSSYISLGGDNTGLYGNNKLEKLSVSKYDKDLNLKWHKRYGEQSLKNFLMKATVLPDGDIVATGFYSKATTLPLQNENSNGVLLRLTAGGSFKWMQTWDHVAPGYQEEGFFGLASTLDKGFIMCGNIGSQPMGTGVSWVVKVDSMGCLVPGCPTTTVQVDSMVIQPPLPVIVNEQEEFREFKVYPNPASEIVFIEGIGNSGVRLQIHDVMGRLYVDQITKDTMINIKSYPPGIYNVSFSDLSGKKLKNYRLFKE